MRTRTLALLSLLTLSLTAAACAPSDEEAEASEGAASKKLKPFLADAKKLKLDDFVRVGVGIATDQLSNALSSGNNGLVFEKPEVFAAAAEPNKIIPDVSEIKALNAIVSGLGARFGERELGSEVNAIRLKHLQGGEDKYYIESAFTAKAGIKHDWNFPADFAAGSFVLGIDAGVELTSRVIVATDDQKIGDLVKAPIEAVKGSRGFLYPRTVAEVKKMKAGEMFALRGLGKFGGNFGLNVPVVQGAIVASVGVAGVISGSLDVQLVKLEGNKVIVDVGVENGKAVSFRAAITDGFGIKGSCEDGNEKFPCLSERGDLGGGITGSIAKAAEKAVVKKLEKHILLNIGGGVSKDSSRVSLSRFRFDLDKGNPDEVEHALQRALKFDVRLAQALYNRDLDEPNPAVVAELDAVRAATTSTRNFGFQLLGMNIYHKVVVEREGSFVLQTPEGTKSILFETKHTDRGVLQHSDESTRTGLSAQTLDANNPGSFRSEANLFLQVASGDTKMNNDFIIDNCDATILGVLGDKGPSAVSELDKFGNAMQEKVLAICDEGKDDSCGTVLVDAPDDTTCAGAPKEESKKGEPSLSDRCEMKSLKAKGNQAIEKFLDGVPADFQNLLRKSTETRMALQSVGIHRGKLFATNGPRVSYTFDARFDDKALGILMSRSKEDYLGALRTYLATIDVERKAPPADPAAARSAALTAVDTKWAGPLAAMAEAFEKNRRAYLDLVATENGVNDAISSVFQKGSKRYAANPLTLHLPVVRSEADAISGATIDAISTDRAKVAVQLFDDLKNAAKGVKDEPLYDQHTAVYPLVSLVKMESLDIAVALRADVKNSLTHNRDRFIKAGFESTVGFSQPFISSNHGHALLVSWNDIKQPKDRSYAIKGSANHDHTFTLTAQQLSDILNGKEVIVTTSETQGHTHNITITHAGDVRATGSQASIIRAGMFDIDAILNPTK